MLLFSCQFLKCQRRKPSQKHRRSQQKTEISSKNIPARDPKQCGGAKGYKTRGGADDEDDDDDDDTQMRAHRSRHMRAHESRDIRAHMWEHT